MVVDPTELVGADAAETVVETVDGLATALLLLLRTGQSVTEAAQVVVVKVSVAITVEVPAEAMPARAAMKTTENFILICFEDGFV